MRGRIRHQLPGRVRIGLEGPLPDVAALTDTARAIASVPGVEQVEFRPETASLLLRHRGRFEPLAAALEEAGLLVLAPAEPVAPIDPVGETFERLERAEDLVGRLTGGRADLWSIAYLGLVAGGLVQLARGRVAGPAVTLFGQAASLALSRSVRRGR